MNLIENHGIKLHQKGLIKNKKIFLSKIAESNGDESCDFANNGFDMNSETESSLEYCGSESNIPVPSIMSENNNLTIPKRRMADCHLDVLVKLLNGKYKLSLMHINNIV